MTYYDVLAELVDDDGDIANDTATEVQTNFVSLQNCSFVVTIVTIKNTTTILLKSNFLIDFVPNSSFKGFYGGMDMRINTTTKESIKTIIGSL